jgi:6-phosphogluconolactonase
VNKNINIIIGDDINDISKKVLKHITEIHNSKINHFYIFPGGRTPVKLFSELSLHINDWCNTNIILSDDRLVDASSKFSNLRVIKKYLIDNIKNKPNLKDYSANIVNELNNERILKKTSKEILKFGKPDLAILGLGNDGHTASLFPRKVELNISNNNLLLIKKDDEPFHRISLTFRCLEMAQEIIFILTGEDKGKVLNRCLYGPYNPDKYPAQYLFRTFKNKIAVYCDKSAAKYLNYD